LGAVATQAVAKVVDFDEDDGDLHVAKKERK
jgi:hypothetical protein